MLCTHYISEIIHWFINNPLPSLLRKEGNYEITILCIFAFKILNQLTDFHKTSYGRYAIGDQPKHSLFDFCKE
jgi:hypothetical protein